MSWHFSQAQVEESSVDICSDGKQCVQLNKSPTPSAYCSKDKMTRFSRLSQYGMTFAPLTEDRGEELLTLYLEAFHVPISPLPVKEQVSKEKKADSGQKWRGSLAKYNPSTHSLKTAQCSLFGDSIQSSAILPNWGSMRDGELWEQTISGQIIKENEFGLSLEMVHTPTATANQMAPSMRKSNYWPTPTAMTGGTGVAPSHKNGTHGWNLGAAVNDSLTKDPTKMWPTPSSRDHKGGYQGGRIRNGKVSRDTLDVAVQYTDNKEKTGGQLNPTWVEWLMGWPLGHTDLKPLETDKYQKWCELHGKY